MNREELKQTTKKFLASPLFIILTILLGLTLVGNFISMLFQGNFDIMGLATGNIFTIIYLIILIAFISSTDDSKKAKNLNGIQTALKVQMILTIVGLVCSILGMLVGFIGFSIVNQGMLNSWTDLELKYREVLQAFIDTKGAFGLAAIGYTVLLVISIGFFASLGGLIKDVKKATYEDGYYHKEKSITAIIWGILYAISKFVLIFASVAFLKRLIAPFFQLLDIMELGFNPDFLKVLLKPRYIAYLRDFIMVAVTLALVVIEFMHYTNCAKGVDAEVKGYVKDFNEGKTVEALAIEEAQVEKHKETQAASEESEAEGQAE